MIKGITDLANTGSALEAIRKGLIRCGFELEFQAVNGMSEDENGMESVEEEISAPHIEVGTDGSVRGGEIRTVGALTPNEFMAAATALFDGHEFDIDTGCSFHIHLSVPGVKHTYGKALQGEMMGYIIENQSRLPSAVRERLKSAAIRFCTFKIDSDKMRAVHGHSQHTWEFRLFGNITTKQDAWKCLLLAIDALRHAYRVRVRKNKPIVSAEIVQDFETLAKAAMDNGRTLAKQARYNKLFKKQHSA